MQNKALFFGIIALAILIVIGLLVSRFFLADRLDLALAEKVSIRIVAAPAVRQWASDAAKTFNQRNPNTQVEIVEAQALVPAAQFRPGGSTPPPAAWLAEASFVVAMAPDNGLQFNDPVSVASSGLAWGAFQSKQDEFNQKYGGLSWQGLHAKAVSPDNGLRFLLASPGITAEGLAALISATAAFSQKQEISGNDVSQADQWLSETFSDNAWTPATPADNFATMGVSAGDAGILTMASWHKSHLNEKPGFVFVPAQPNVNLDYPLAIFSQAEPAAQQAAAAFRAFLLEENQQAALAPFFLDRASAAQPGVKADGAATLRLLNLAQRLLQ